mmetsp:Transcript_18813/g.35846  ORF Transcript_18813/g.35846 Transcript_18813/m.35846 type:complete len:224 (+) Transcript_18813:579-1250(+)
MTALARVENSPSNSASALNSFKRDGICSRRRPEVELLPLVADKIEGANVATAVGATVGMLVALPVGAVVLSALPVEVVGLLVVLPLKAVGLLVALPVEAVGVLVALPSIAVGLLVVLPVAAVGLLVALPVGAFVGFPDGDVEGLVVGVLVGLAEVGTAVGLMVGADDPYSPSMDFTFWSASTSVKPFSIIDIRSVVRGFICTAASKFVRGGDLRVKERGRIAP